MSLNVGEARPENESWVSILAMLTRRTSVREAGRWG